MDLAAIAAIPEQTVDEALALIDEQFDADEIAGREIDLRGVEEYYQQSDRGYRLFHSREGALHIALGCDGHHDTGGYTRQAEIFLEHMEATIAHHALELGCGMGFNVRWLAQQRPDCTFLGIDLTEPHIREAMKRGKDLAHAEFVVGDYERLIYEDNSFDAILAVETLCQTPNLEQALAESHRVLRPGRRLVVIDCFRRAPLETFAANLQRAARLVEKTTAVNAFSVVEDWIALAKSIGFELVETRDLSSETQLNLTRLYRLAHRFFKMPRAARAMTKAFPAKMLENSICGLLMPFTVGNGAHTYQAIVVEK